MRPNPLIPIFDMLAVVVVGLCGEETSVEEEKSKVRTWNGVDDITGRKRGLRGRARGERWSGETGNGVELQ